MNLRRIQTQITLLSILMLGGCIASDISGTTEQKKQLQYSLQAGINKGGMAVHLPNSGSFINSGDPSHIIELLPEKNNIFVNLQPTPLSLITKQSGLMVKFRL